MRLFSRDNSQSLTSLASSLSLVVANYKPVPQLPSASSSNSSSKGISTKAGDLNVHGFQTQSTGYKNPHADVSKWGEVSVLYVPETNDTSSSSRTGTHKLASSATVGPGKCPLNTDTYTPKGELGDPVFDDFDSVKATVMRYRQQISVNLGAWFVQEGWMQGNFMSCATQSSEYGLVSGFGTSANGLKSAQYYLEEHWDTWITEDDFKYLQSKGVNTVRIPIGYWTVGPYFTHNSPFSDYADVYSNSWKYVARAIRWAAKYDIGVLIDLHGAYGSQNGNDHSGITGQGVQFYTDTNMDLTKGLLTWLSWEIADVTNVIGIQLLNEPQDNTKLWPWYNETMDAMRQSSSYAKSLPLYFHDAFNMAKGAKFVSQRDDFVVQDYHSYFVYTSSDTSLSAQGHTSQIQGSLQTKFTKQSGIGRRNMIVGEWSCALAPSSLSGSSNKDADTATYCAAQMNMYANTTSGYHYWSYKMENCDSNAGWCFKAALGKYLPSYLNTWGFNGFVTNRKILLNLAASKTVSASIVAAISKLSATSSTSSSSFARVAAVSADKESNDYSKGTNPIVGMVQSTTSSAAKSERRGVGSPASRAGHLARRATDAVTAAQQAGFSDGYLTSTYLASSLSTTSPMSRLGFGEQYIIDSWAKRVSWDTAGKTYLQDNYGHYRTHFMTATAQAEAAIVGLVNAAAIPSS
ncbi:glycoside hydrolase [Jaminaea rosea]|uniref:Glycoside hydrolase n=1 Tax=Jaminaea rosea TaxID=1569628 RepID=A0A316URP3_9BASI|nr:glycoside hydrolase [Jaminaea rosea]PWN27962.1 glycoside hydrolase [Jaminaea rosea]